MDRLESGERERLAGRRTERQTDRQADGFSLNPGMDQSRTRAGKEKSEKRHQNSHVLKEGEKS